MPLGIMMLYGLVFIVILICILHLSATLPLKYENCMQYIFLAMGMGFIWVVRYPILQMDVPLNPDEPVLTAMALRVHHGWYNWDTLDPLTSGPLNAIVFAWPYLFGFEPTLSTSRIVGTLVISLVCLFLYLTVKRIGGSLIAILFTLPLFIFYGATNFEDFVHHSSEHLSVLLGVFAMYCFVRTLDLHKPRDMRVRVFFLGSLAIGAMPFAKLQALPLAVLIGVVFLLSALFSRSSAGYWRRIIAVLIGGLLTGLFFLLPLALSGNLHHFVSSYVLTGTYYVKPPLSFSEFVEISAMDRLYFVTFTAFMISAMIGYIILPIYLKSLIKYWVVISFIFFELLVAYYSIVISGHNFPHYLHYILPIMALTAGALSGVLIELIFSRRLVKVVSKIMLAVVMLIFIIPVADAEIRNAHLIQERSQFIDGLSFHSPNILQWLQPTQADTLMVWGWAAQFYVASGLTPATREPMTYHQMVPDTEKQFSYYRERFINDFTASKPDFIIDSVTSMCAFPFKYRASFSPLTNIIQDDFIEMTKPHSNKKCARLYVRRERAQKLNLTNIEIANITASAQYDADTHASNLDDNSVWEGCGDWWTENACVDWWALPNHQLGFVNLTFKHPSAVSKVEILNTRYFPTDKVAVSILWQGKVLYRNEVNLNHYPRWTTLYIPSMPHKADAIRIDILAFSKKRAGLNEVKIVRPDV